MEDDRLLHLLLRLYLDRYESSKSSSMKQVLNTLIDLLLNLPERCAPLQCRRLITEELLRILLYREDHTRSKPALLALTLFISRSVITSEVLLEICNESAEEFLSQIFAWAAHPNVAGLVGRFVATFSPNDPLLQSNLGNQLSTHWVRPLMSVIRNHPTSLGAFKTYLMPSLFKDVQQFWIFLDHIHCPEQLGLACDSNRSKATSRDSPTAGSVSEPWEQADVVLCAALQVGREKGLIEVCGMIAYAGVTLDG